MAPASWAFFWGCVFCGWGFGWWPAAGGWAVWRSQITALVRYALRDGKLEQVARTEAPALLQAPAASIISTAEGGAAFLVSGNRGSLESLGWSGRRAWELPLTGGPAPTLSAADLNGDGRAELVAAAGRRVRVFSFDRKGQAKETAGYDFLGSRYRLSPLLYDLEGNGRLCLVVPGQTDDGHVAVRAFRADGRRLWETALEMSIAGGGMAVSWNAGQFLPGPRAGVAISVGNAERTHEGTYLLDGRTGKVLWFKDLHRDGDSIRGFVPLGVPGAFDWEGDGQEEILMDLYSYLALVRGADGGFAFIRHTENIRAQGALFAGTLYHSFCPVFKTPDAPRPHWLTALGHGTLGLCDPEPSQGAWRHELGYDTPEKIGMVDVDGDGRMDVGYAPARDPVFRCRDLWTGAVKWELKLPSTVAGPVLAADVDGDGKGEFLVSRYCIGTNAEGKGEIRWTSPHAFGWGIIADFDGDGRGEIACTSRGQIHILKGGGVRPAPNKAPRRRPQP